VDSLNKMIDNSKNTGKYKFGYNGFVYEAKFQRTLDEERGTEKSLILFSV